MKKKNGFIAVSLIYSFFLVFLMIMLASSTKNAENRQLLRIFKDDLQGQLNQEEFVITVLSNRTYNVDEEINFVDDQWQVVKDNGASVTLILKRSLTKDEVIKVLEVDENNTSYFDGNCNNTICKIRMCMNNYAHDNCYFESTSNYFYYNWQNSIAKVIVERWFEQNNNLQKACRLQYDELKKEQICQKDTLVKMTFTDGIQNNTGYIRLPTIEESSSKKNWVITNNMSWTLSLQKKAYGKSYIYNLNGDSYSNETALEIRPVIEVRKS